MLVYFLAKRKKVVKVPLFLTQPPNYHSIAGPGLVLAHPLMCLQPYYFLLTGGMNDLLISFILTLYFSIHIIKLQSESNDFECLL